MAYIPRKLEATISRYLKVFPAIGLTGPRQSGKTTLLMNSLPSKYRYVSFDDFEMIRSYHRDPSGFLDEFDNLVVFDEVQKVPEIFSSIKIAIDHDRSRCGKFILTGSSQFAFMKNITESLAGRIGLLTLLPFQRNEIPEKLHNRSVYLGGYPEQVAHQFRENRLWYSSYIETYLQRDVRDLSNIGNLREFRRCLQLLAARTAQVLHYSDLAKDLGVAVNTIKNWISVLEASYIIFLVPPYYNNLGKRIVKSPKLYFYDTGLVSFLTGITTEKVFSQGPMYGQLYENYIVSEIMKKEIHSCSLAELFYYRTSNQTEIDLVIDRKSSHEFVEIKASKTFRIEMTEGIRKIKQPGEKGTLIYQGKNLELHGNIQVVNHKTYLL